jgi:hypothetical protein
VLYTICAGLLTFENGPATYVGNHYFSAWAGFFISFIIFGSVMKEFLGVGAAAAPAASSSTGNFPNGLLNVCSVNSFDLVLTDSLIFHLLFVLQNQTLKWTGYK